jgi:GGDEF domain-containing protein
MPVGIFLVNSDDRIIWVNKTLCEQVGLEARQLIGHMRSELPGTNIFPITERIARQHINNPSNETLFNFNYLSKKLETEFDEIVEIGCLVKFTNFADDQVQFGFDQVEEQTGLYTRHGILKKLSLHVSRSRRYFNPLSVIMLRVVPDSNVNSDSINRAIAMILREKLRWVDDVGHWNMSDFLLVLPETGEDAANKLARKIKFQLNRFKLPENHKKIPTTIAVSSWRKGEDETKLLKRVTDQLNEHRYKLPTTSRIS